MDGYSVFLALLAVYIAGLVAIGWYFNKKNRNPLPISGLRDEESGPQPRVFSSSFLAYGRRNSCSYRVLHATGNGVCMGFCCP